ncbi:MAG: cytochrome c oxidase subunit 3, partial [Candidatus Omnitrophota bacterium]|nr:cytochrome c oxidase subunit 3 [Candidatus Omnitrophota bacterium]
MAPHGHDARAVEAPSSGIPNGKLGMWVFLASEVMFFVGLLGAYIVLRAGLGSWPHPGEELNIPTAAFNTFILLTSSMTMALSVAAVDRADKAKLRLFLMVTIVLGLAFLGVKGYEYSLKFAHGHFPGTGIFWDCYFTLTGVH